MPSMTDKEFELWQNQYAFDRELYLRLHDEYIAKNGELCSQLEKANEKINMLTIQVNVMWAKMLAYAAAITLGLNIIGKFAGPLLRLFQSSGK